METIQKIINTCLSHPGFTYNDCEGCRFRDTIIDTNINEVDYVCMFGGSPDYWDVKKIKEALENGTSET